MSALFRLFGTVCQSYDLAARLAAVIISALVVFAGYVIPRDAMYRWLFWIAYINPLYFAFSAVMANEFKDLSLACVGSYIVPRIQQESTNTRTTWARTKSVPYLALLPVTNS